MIIFSLSGFGRRLLRWNDNGRPQVSIFINLIEVCLQSLSGIKLLFKVPASLLQIILLLFNTVVYDLFDVIGVKIRQAVPSGVLHFLFADPLPFLLNVRIYVKINELRIRCRRPIFDRMILTAGPTIQFLKVLLEVVHLGWS